MDDTDQWAKRRQGMVTKQLVNRDIHDPAVLTVMGTVPRHEFVSALTRRNAYADRPLPIGDGQTISQPYIVALMAQALELEPTAPSARTAVLEVGTGSGYGAAVLSHLADRVVSIERLESLADRARATLDGLGYTNVEVVAGDGTLGWEPGAPYDGIVVTAGGPTVPSTLVDQLRDGGRLVIPVGEHGDQDLLVVTRVGSTTSTTTIAGVRFVPLIGAEGWRG